MRISFTLLLCLLAGCHGFRLTRAQYVEPPSTDPTHELSQNPTILITAPQDWALMSLHGVHLGDDPASIDSRLIQQRDKEWIIFRDANKIRIGASGQVAQLGLWNQKAVTELGITSQDDIDKKFGKPVHTLLLTDSTIYIFQDQHIHVIWRSLEGKVIGVNVVK